VKGGEKSKGIVDAVEKNGFNEVRFCLIFLMEEIEDEKNVYTWSCSVDCSDDGRKCMGI
jgi:predicted ester cyclase